MLQKYVYFEVKNKIIKKGKIILFFQRNFHIIFILENDKNKKDKIEIPIPFEIEFHNEKNGELLYFDYRFSTLEKKFPEAQNTIKLLSLKNSNSKYFNSILTIIENKNYD